MMMMMMVVVMVVSMSASIFLVADWIFKDFDILGTRSLTDGSVSLAVRVEGSDGTLGVDLGDDGFLFEDSLRR